MPRIAATLFLLLFGLTSYAQRDSAMSVYLYDTKFKHKSQHQAFNRDSFYLHRGVVYWAKIRLSYHRPLQLLDITENTLVFRNLSGTYRREADTFFLKPGDLTELQLNPRGMSQKLLLHNHRYIFNHDTGSAYIAPQPGVTWIKQREIHYEKLPEQTAKGITFSYIPDSLSGRAEPDPALIDRTYRKRNIIGFTPAKREEINGIAFGLLSENRKNHKYKLRDTLVTRGLNIEVHPMSLLFAFFIPYIGEIGKHNYSYEQYLQESAPDWETKMYGVNISLMHIGSRRIYGLNISPTMTVVDEMHGLTITPIVNYAMVQKGTMIALYNNSKRSRGFQLGLINNSKDHRGLQIGLWNTNAKRRLPFINWQLKAAVPDSSLHKGN